VAKSADHQIEALTALQARPSESSSPAQVEDDVARQFQETTRSRKAAPEKAEHMVAMRELANLTAAQALKKSSHKRRREAVREYFISAVVVGVVAVLTSIYLRLGTWSLLAQVAAWGATVFLAIRATQMWSRARGIVQRPRSSSQAVEASDRGPHAEANPPIPEKPRRRASGPGSVAALDQGVGTVETESSGPLGNTAL
jgi:hypothetical protein